MNSAIQADHSEASSHFCLHLVGRKIRTDCIHTSRYGPPLSMVVGGKQLDELTTYLHSSVGRQVGLWALEVAPTNCTYTLGGWCQGIWALLGVIHFLLPIVGGPPTHLLNNSGFIYLKNNTNISKSTKWEQHYNSKIAHRPICEIIKQTNRNSTPATLTRQSNVSELVLCLDTRVVGHFFNKNTPSDIHPSPSFPECPRTGMLQVVLIGANKVPVAVRVIIFFVKWQKLWKWLSQNTVSK
jgi:hypothetical protein